MLEGVKGFLLCMGKFNYIWKTIFYVTYRGGYFSKIQE